MLTAYDVIGLKIEDHIILMYLAILTSMTGPFGNSNSKGIWNGAAQATKRRRARAFANAIRCSKAR